MSHRIRRISLELIATGMLAALPVAVACGPRPAWAVDEAGVQAGAPGVSSARSSSPVSADEPAARPAAVSALTLRALQDEALRRSPRIAAAKARWEAAEKRIAQAWALPDPKAGYMVMGDDMVETRVGPQEEVYEVEQMIPFPGKLWQRRHMAKAEARAAEAAFRAVERDVLLDVSSVYYDLYATEASIGVVNELLQRLRQLEQVAQARYAGQGGSQRDVAKTQTEVSMTLERVFMLRQQRDSLAARLNALLNRPGHTPVGASAEPERPSLAADLDTLLAAAEASRPELAQAEFMVEKERRADRLARLEYVPDVSVGFRYIEVGGGMTSHPDDGQDVWMIPIMVTLPIWQNRIVPAIQEARRNLAASEEDLAEERNVAEYDVRDRYYRYQTARQVLELYETALVPESELAFRSDLAGYEAGTQDVLNLIDSERVYLNARVAAYQALAEWLKSFAELERAVGRPLAALEVGATERMAP